MDNDNLFDQENKNGEQPYQNTQGQYQQPYNQYQPYNQPWQQNYIPDVETEEPVSFADWMVTILLTYVPCVNIIVMLMWAFGSGTKKSKSNFAKAKLVWMIIGVIVSAVVTFMYIGTIMALLDKGGYIY